MHFRSAHGRFVVINGYFPGVRTTLTYNRLNAHYETAHQLGWLLFDALGIDDLFVLGEAQSFSFLLNMNQLFEQIEQGRRTQET